MSEDREITELLRAWSSGERQALDLLFPVVYEELRRLSKHYLRGERVGHTLQTTALVHEAYIRLSRSGRLEFKDRGHFFAISARIMRQILVDFARRKNFKKRGEGSVAIEISEELMMGGDINDEFLGLDEALKELAEFDVRKSCVVELKFFGGLSIDEIASALGVSSETVKRDWRLARSWLRIRLRP